MSLIQGVRSAPYPQQAQGTPGRQVAVFSDRDGVFNEVDKHVNTPQQLLDALIPESIQAAARLTRELDCKLVIVTNQGGIDAGFMSAEQNQAIQETLVGEIEKAGGRADAVLFCPNGKKFKVPEGESDGRKPDAGMFYFAANHFGPSVDFADSYMIGDMSTDIAAGEKADGRITTILVETGFAGKDGKVPFKADEVKADFSSAVDFILAREQSR